MARSPRSAGQSAWVRSTIQPGALIRFETEPGRQMQVDFVVFKRCGVRLPAFVATLGYSRRASFGSSRMRPGRR